MYIVGLAVLAIFIYLRVDLNAKNFFNTKVLYHSPITKLRFDRYNRILTDNFEYFVPLSPQGKAKFITRVNHIISNKDFVGYEGMKVTEEHKVLIAASMVQLTYGIADFRFNNIERVMIFPRQFYSRRIEHDVKGLTSNEGWVALSWEDFEEGYAIADDSYNLGLHEMAHALKLYAIMEQFDDSFSDKLRHFQSYALGEMHNMREGYPSFLREYASNNLQEFFAVSVENFFEAPDKLKNSLPHIFQHLAILLNQNPLNTTNDYKVNKLVRQLTEEPVVISGEKKISNAGYNARILGCGFFTIVLAVFLIDFVNPLVVIGGTLFIFLAYHMDKN